MYKRQGVLAPSAVKAKESGPGQGWLGMAYLDLGLSRIPVDGLSIYFVTPCNNILEHCFSSALS